MINLEVKIGIWICENPRNSHENVIDWLNEVSPKDMSFYLIKIKIIKIGENEYMPQFDIISGPNDEFTIIGAKKKEWSDIDFKFYDFWEQFLVKCKKASLFQNRKKTKGHYICSSRGLKEGYMYCVSILRRQKQFSVEIYIDTGEKEINKKEYDELYVKKDLIEDKFGQKLDWKRLDEKRASRIIYRGVGDWIDESNWDNLQERMVNKLIELDKSFRDHISDS